MGLLRMHVLELFEFNDLVGGFFVWVWVMVLGVSVWDLVVMVGWFGFVFLDGSVFVVLVDSFVYGYVRIVFS